MQPYSGYDDYAFLSYSHKDKEIAMRLIDNLINVGCRIWYDNGIPPSTEWAEIIATRLSNAKLFIVLLSNNSIKSQNVKREIYSAVDNDIPILPVYLDDVTLTSGLKMQLSISQAIKSDAILDRALLRETKPLMPQNIFDNLGKLIASYKNIEYRIIDDFDGFVIVSYSNNQKKELFKKDFSKEYQCFTGIHSINKAIPYEFHIYKKSTLFFQVFCDLLTKDNKEENIFVNYKFAITNANNNDHELILEECQSKGCDDIYPNNVKIGDEYFIKDDK